MSVYLHDIPLEDAKAHFETALKEVQLWGVLGNETIPLDENALGRVLAEPIRAKVSSRVAVCTISATSRSSTTAAS